MKPPDPSSYEPEYEEDAFPEDDEANEDTVPDETAPICHLCNRFKPKQLLPCKHVFHMRCLLRAAFDGSCNHERMTGKFACPKCARSFKWHGWPRHLTGASTGNLLKILGARADAGELLLRTGSASPSRLQAILDLQIGDGDVLRMLLAPRLEFMDQADFDELLTKGPEGIFTLMLERRVFLLEPDPQVHFHAEDAFVHTPTIRRSLFAGQRRKERILGRTSSTIGTTRSYSFFSKGSVTKSSMSLASASTLATTVSQESADPSSIYYALRKNPFVAGDLVRVMTGEDVGVAEVGDVIRKTGQCRILFEDADDAKMVPHKCLALVRFANS